VSAAPADLEAELARVRAERDAARAELSELRVGQPSRHVTRKIIAGFMVFLSCVSFLTGGIGIWASRSLLDTDVWVDHVGPLADDPGVQAAISAQITAEIMKLIDPQALFEEALPERGQVLAVPLSGAVQSFVGDQVDKFVASDAFDRLWVGLNEQAHATAVKVLRGDSEVVQAGDKTVTLSLIPVINEVLANITKASPEIFGKTINIPDVQIDEIPTAAIDKINDVFGTDLPPDFGQITIYDGGELKEVQDAIALFDRLVWVSIVVFVLATVGAFAASVNRRRTLVQLAIVDVLLLILMRRAAITAQDQLLALVRVDSNVPAVKATSDALLQGLFDGTRILLWFFGILIALAWLTGSSKRAVAFRSRTVSVASGLTSAARERGTDPATTAWLVEHRDALRIAGVVVAVVLLWWLNLSWLGVLILLALVAGYEVLLGRLEDDDSTAGGPGPGALIGEPVEEESAPSPSPT
jgi:hypothetical protein